MKIRFLIAVSLSLTGLTLLDASAALPGSRAPLPNFNQWSAPTTAALVGSPTNVSTPALSRLQSLVPGLKYEQNSHLGTPRYLSAERGFLTGSGGVGKGLSASALAAQSAADPYRVVKAFVNDNASLFGHDAQVFNSTIVKADGVTPRSGLHTVIWQQQLDNIPVYGGLFVSHSTRNDELVAVSDRLMTGLDQAAAAISRRDKLESAPPIGAADAVTRAAINLGEDSSAIMPQSVDGVSGDAVQRQDFSSARLRGAAHAQLVWLPLGSSQMTLCWQVVLTARVRSEMYLVLVDAQTGEIRLRHCLTADASPITLNVFTSDSPSPFSPAWSTPSAAQPPPVSRTLVTLVALDTNASPAGWINDGVLTTTGNNVDAHLDRNDDNIADLPRVQGTTNRVFDFPMDLTQSPLTYGDASVVNLFYWNNFMHDKLYEYGFTEVFGNFQNTNFNRGGFGNDAVQADGQDGGGTDNANFSVPPDGIPGRMQMYLFDGANPYRDGSLDAEVMCHEYTHGLSNRLLGGGVLISDLQPSGMGEGWSDFVGMSLLSAPADDPHAVYATGGYVTYHLFGLEDNYYFGIRRYPYCTDMSKNPLTLKDIDPTQASAHPGVPISPVFGGGPADEVHDMGEVWCMTLWEARANLIDKLGGAQGNQTMLQLVIDGLKLAPANATYLEARDAIIKADEILTGGDNAYELWSAFAKRGMGYYATVPASTTTIGIHEDYTIPDYVIPDVPDGIMVIRTLPPTTSTLFGGETNIITVRVTDGSGVTNATVTGTLSTGETLTFLNDGTYPDLSPSNAVYTAAYLAPNVETNVLLTLVTSAPDKDTSTNLVSYFIIGPPPNDYFTNAVKVSATGGFFLSNNERATIEANEPVHAGVPSVGNSLWWNFTPSSSGSVLVDTAGSTFNTVLAVYTNNTLATLKPVVSADDVGSRLQAFVYFNANAGVTYRIAVASFDTNNTGTVRLTITPGGTADTSPPTLTVISPLSGVTVRTNKLLFTGTAVDPDPNASGLQEVDIRVRSAVGQTDIQFDPRAASLISTNWSKLVGFYEGLNVVTLSVTDIAGNQSAPITMQVNYVPFDPVNDFFANAIALTGDTGVSSVNNRLATKEVGEPVHANNPGGKSVWWTYQPAADGVLQLSTTNSTFDTLLGVYTGAVVGDLTSIAQNDDAYAGAANGFSSVSLAVRSNVVYRIAVDGYDGAWGVVFLGYDFAPAKVYHLTVNSTTGGTTDMTGADVASNATIQVTALPASGYLFDHWAGAVTSASNPLSVLVKQDSTVTAYFRPVTYSDGFESGSFSALPWVAGGDAPWTVQTNIVAAGSFAARSGVITNGQTSSLLLTTNFQAGPVSFEYRVSSEPGWDFLKFLVDGVVQQQWSGEVPWTSFAFPLTAGTHTLEWRYTKDPVNSSGLDAAFIDNLNLPFAVLPDATSPAHLVLTRIDSGNFYIDIFGQTNQTYAVQVSTDLKTWQTISTSVAANGVIRIQDSIDASLKTRFYRAIVPATP